jgi:hypothetical protein
MCAMWAAISGAQSSAFHTGAGDNAPLGEKVGFQLANRDRCRKDEHDNRS